MIFRLDITKLSYIKSVMFFVLIKCKNCIDQKQQDKLAEQAVNQQYKWIYISRQREQTPLNKPQQDKLAKQKAKGTDSLVLPKSKGTCSLEQASKSNGNNHTLEPSQQTKKHLPRSPKNNSIRRVDLHPTQQISSNNRQNLQHYPTCNCHHTGTSNMLWGENLTQMDPYTKQA